MPTKSRTKLAIALMLLSGAPLTCTYAAKPVIKEYSFDLTSIDKIDVHGSVGSIHIIPTKAKRASVVLEITQQNRHWFQRDLDLSEVELDSHVRGNLLALRQTDEDLNIEWTLELPAVETTSIDLGVGKIEGKLGDTRLRVKVGVGDVELSMPLATTGEVELKTGVGDASLHGGESKRHKQSFVSQDVEGHGNGDNSVYVKVGVGHVSLNLDQPARL